MANKKTNDPADQTGQKSQAAKRTVNPPASGPEGAPGPDNTDAPDQHRDPKNRQGNFGGKGEHPRTGTRGH